MLPSLAIALGANLGDPAATLLAVRPLLEAAVAGWWPGDRQPPPPRCRWSPLFRTEPVGGPSGQPPYLNAVLVAGPLPERPPDPGALLRQLQGLEGRFGRIRGERWGPRHLDLDLLWCGALECRRDDLTLPHPHLGERSFVLAPLAAIDPELVPPGQRLPCATRLAALLPQLAQSPPLRLPPRAGWPE